MIPSITPTFRSMSGIYSRRCCRWGCQQSRWFYTKLTYSSAHTRSPHSRVSHQKWFLVGLFAGATLMACLKTNPLHAAWSDWALHRPPKIEVLNTPPDKDDSVPQSEPKAKRSNRGRAGAYHGFIADAVEPVMSSVVNIVIETSGYQLILKPPVSHQ